MNSLREMKSMGCGGHRYINVHLLKNSQHFMINKRDTGTDIIKKLKVPRAMWIYGSIVKGELVRERKSLRVYVRRSWLIEYLDKYLRLIGEEEEEEEDEEEDEDTEEEDDTEEEEDDTEEDDEQDIEDEQPRRVIRSNRRDVPEDNTEDSEPLIYDAPALIKIPKNKMFMVNGEYVDIETRGTRTWDGCYFSLESIGKAYGISMPRTVIYSKHGRQTYKYGEDYVKFRVSKRVNGKNTSTEKIYMLMPGLINMLAAAQTAESKHFIKWICVTIFTVAMGTDNQKLRLLADSMDVSLANAHKVLGKCPRVMQGIYYLRIADRLETLINDKKIGDLIRKAIKNGTVDKSDHFIKVGMSKKYDETEIRQTSQLGLARRFAEHEQGFSKITGTDPKVISFGDVLDKQIASAEKAALDTAREYCRDFAFPKHDEWFALPAEKAADFKAAIDNIIREHEITYDDLLMDVEKRDKTIAELQASMKLALSEHQSEVKLHTKEIEKLNKVHEVELRARDDMLKTKDSELKTKDEMIELLKGMLAGGVSQAKKSKPVSLPDEEPEPRRRPKKSRR